MTQAVRLAQLGRVAQESEQAAESSLGWCALQQNKTNRTLLKF